MKETILARLEDLRGQRDKSLAILKQVEANANAIIGAIQLAEELLQALGAKTPEPPNGGGAIGGEPLK